MRFLRAFKKYRIGTDTTIDSIGIIDNKLPVCTFFDNILLEKPSEIKVLTYTIEGEPTLRYLVYDGKNIKYTFDVISKIQPQHGEYIGNKFIKEKRGNFIHYDLYKDNKFLTSMLAYRN